MTNLETDKQSAAQSVTDGNGVVEDGKVRMERMRVRSIQEAEESIVGTTVKVSGWLRTVRDQKKFAFMNVNDGSSLSGVQVVVDGGSEFYDTAKSLSTGSAVSVVGTVVKR